MSSSTSKASNISAKSMNSNQATTATIQPTPSSSASIDNNNNRRNGVGGAAATARNNQPNPRGNQNVKRNHVDRRRPSARDHDYQEQMAHLDVEIERASSGNSRKGTSITHLMNWDLQRRAIEHHYRPRNSYYQRRNPTWGLGSGYHAVDKARYVNANYRFIVDPVGDYRPQSIDSDITIPWDKVLQVLASAKSQTASCPICLCVPVAPRMAKCGHIFCLPCLMRYMASIDDVKQQTPLPEKKPKFKKCPICWDSIYMSDVRPVRWFTGQEGDILQDGMDVVLRLMKRRHGTTLALPRDGAEIPEEADGIPWHFAAEVADYARIMKGTKSYMEGQLNQEVQDLKVMGQEDELMFNEEGEWTRKAIASIKGSIEGLNIKDVELPQTPIIEEPKPERPKLIVNENVDDIPDMYLVSHAARSGQVSPAIRPDAETVEEKKKPDVDPPAIAPRITDDRRAPPSDDSAYYFYRALPHYYLSPLDIRILRAAFGAYENFPATILPRVEAVSTGHTVDDELRRRTKYLAHLPYGTEVAFLECNWTDVVPPGVLNQFKTEIDRRSKKRRDKELQEEKDRQRAEKEERESRWPIQHRREEPSPSTGLGRFTEDDFVALAISQSQATTDTTPSLAPPGLEDVEANTSSPGISPSARRTVWGTPAVTLSDDAYLTQAPPRERRDDDRWADGWERDYLLEEDLIAHHHLDDGLARTPGFNPMGGGKGRGGKKKKKVVLMNNGGKRGA